MTAPRLGSLVLSRQAAPIALALYLLTPAAPGSPLGAWPLTPVGALSLAVAIGTALLAWRLPVAGAMGRLATVATLVLIGTRIVLAPLVPETGWLAHYYANASWSGSPEWSSDYRLANATRIDRALSFEGRSFPVHYLNGPAFETGNAREISEPMSVEWRGVFTNVAPDVLNIDVTARGSAAIEIDGRPVASTDAAAQVRLDLGAGNHYARVRYLKSAGEQGALGVQLRDSKGSPLAIFPEGTTPNRRPMLTALAAASDWMATGLLVLMTLEILAVSWRASHRMKMLGAVLVVVALGLQGYLTARSQLGFQTLTGGDDWLGFESRAREILQHGLLMPLGRTIGEGVPYFYHPFYSYFLAAVHLVTGESLFGPIFAHFLILAATALIVWTLAARLFGGLPASAGVAALIVIFEIDFIRYYTVKLLSDNLYVLTVSCCLVAFAKWAETARTINLVAAGFWGGVSSVTRPAMLVFLVPALAVTALIARRQGRSLAAPCIAAVSWLAVVFPFTLRNWMVSGQWVMVSSGQGGAVIVHNVPPPFDPQPYFQMFLSGQAGTVAVLWQVLMEHPAEMVALHARKFGFTLGMTQWFEGYRPHPELVAISLLYGLALVFSKTMRRHELWPVHAFVGSHWASMALTSPWNYGYRLILPPFVFTTTLSVAAAVALVAPWRARMGR